MPDLLGHHSPFDTLTPIYNEFTGCLPCVPSVGSCHLLFSPPKPPPCRSASRDLKPPGPAEEWHSLQFAHLGIQIVGGTASPIYSALENSCDKENPISGEKCLVHLVCWRLQVLLATDQLWTKCRYKVRHYHQDGSSGSQADIKSRTLSLFCNINKYLYSMRNSSAKEKEMQLKR